MSIRLFLRQSFCNLCNAGNWEEAHDILLSNFDNEVINDATINDCLNKRPSKEVEQGLMDYLNWEKEGLLACKQGRLFMVQELFKHNMNKRTKKFALKFACIYGHLSIVQYLISTILNEDEKTNFCDYNNTLFYDFIHEKDGKINSYDCYNTAFKFACYHGCLEVAQWLLDENKDIDVFAIVKSQVSSQEILTLLNDYDLPKYKGAVKK